jgi:hypothetical protein
MSRTQKQKRTHIIGALIFVALVAFVGVGLVATGNFHNPFTLFAGGEHRGGPGVVAGHAVNFHADRGAEFAPSDHAGGPDGENNGGIAWNQIGAVFSDLWILCVIAAGYILIQQILFRLDTRKAA